MCLDPTFPDFQIIRPGLVDFCCNLSAAIGIVSPNGVCSDEVLTFLVKGTWKVFVGTPLILDIQFDV